MSGRRSKRKGTSARADRTPWLVVMEADTLLKLLRGDEDAGQDHRREAGVAEEGR